MRAESACGAGTAMQAYEAGLTMGCLTLAVAGMLFAGGGGVAGVCCMC